VRKKGIYFVALCVPQNASVRRLTKIVPKSWILRFIKFPKFLEVTLQTDEVIQYHMYLQQIQRILCTALMKCISADSACKILLFAA